jgi:hypothetical protein
MAKYRVVFGGKVYGDADVHSQFDRLISALSDFPIQDAEMTATVKSKKFSIVGYVEADDRDTAMDIACSWEAKVEAEMWVEILVTECSLI